MRSRMFIVGLYFVECKDLSDVICFVGVYKGGSFCYSVTLLFCYMPCCNIHTNQWIYCWDVPWRVLGLQCVVAMSSVGGSSGLEACY